MYVLGILEHNSQLLLLLRQNAKFFSGYYGLMGGKIEENESPYAALIREAYEEIGISIAAENLHFVHCLSFKNEADEKVLALVFKITNWHGQLINKEPDKCAALAWFSYDNLPENIIPRHKLILEQLKKSVMYSECGW
jgi:8-oxo-dGTP diphosphatase